MNEHLPAATTQTQRYRFDAVRQGLTRLGLAALLMAGVAFAGSPARAEPFAYVANYRSNDVTVIDTADNTDVATVPVGSRPIGIAITPDRAFAYVTNSFSNTVSVIETKMIKREVLLDTSKFKINFIER